MTDLRSDTVTQPTEGMLKAMLEAASGDDVYQEDPSVNELQEYTAQITGMEASLFMPSGCMANLTALYILGRRGNEVICHPLSHIMQHELASPAVIAGVLLTPVPGERGIITAEGIMPYIRRPDPFSSHTSLVSIENSANMAGGTCYDEPALQKLRELTEQEGLYLHMDGARAFNAAEATGISVGQMAGYVDSLTLCLSKGLGAPAGSMLCGKAEFIKEARRVRKLLGGGMRQAGYYAAAGLYALKHHIRRLAEDHLHARIIGEAVSQSSWGRLAAEPVETNIVIASVHRGSTEEVLQALKHSGVLAGPAGRDAVRFVTHLGLDRGMIDQASEMIKTLNI